MGSKIKVVVAPLLTSLQKELDKWLEEEPPVTITDVSLECFKDGTVGLIAVYEESSGVQGAGYEAPQPTPSQGANPVHPAPICPKCNGEMILRYRKVDGQPFWGCSSFPNCRSIVAYDKSVEENPDVVPADRKPASSSVGPSTDSEGGLEDDGDNIPF